MFRLWAGLDRQELVVELEHFDEPESTGLDCGIMRHCNDISIPLEGFEMAIHGLYRLGWGLKLLAYKFEAFPPPALTAASTIVVLPEVW